jgi:hypothetical protein
MILHKFVLSDLVGWLPLVEWNQICLQKIASMVPSLVEPISDALMGHVLAKMPL